MSAVDQTSNDLYLWSLIKQKTQNQSLKREIDISDILERVGLLENY